MTLPEFMKSTRAVAVMLDERGILQQTYTTASLRPSSEFAAYAMSVNPDYQELYRIGLRNRDYNFLLVDYSFLQFAYGGDGDYLSLRFAYYANPFVSVSPETVMETCDGADYELHLQLLEENEERSDALVIRYEVATRDYVELRHPAAHFHIGLHEGRWPVDKILSPKAFTLFIAKLFYAPCWNDAADDQLATEKHSCEVLADNLFSARDRRHLYFT
jgi:hypothetical protein